MCGQPGPRASSSAAMRAMDAALLLKSFSPWMQRDESARPVWPDDSRSTLHTDIGTDWRSEPAAQSLVASQLRVFYSSETRTTDDTAKAPYEYIRSLVAA